MTEETIPTADNPSTAVRTSIAGKFYYDRVELRERGWSLGMIKKYLSWCEYPVKIGSGRFYHDRCCYLISDVHAVEKGRKFKADFHRKNQRRGVGNLVLVRFGVVAGGHGKDGQRTDSQSTPAVPPQGGDYV